MFSNGTIDLNNNLNTFKKKKPRTRRFHFFQRRSSNKQNRNRSDVLTFERTPIRFPPKRSLDAAGKK